MKFVRWLGAFREKGKYTLLESAQFEKGNKTRQVAVEPLLKGKSLITQAVIGLELDHESSQFVVGFLHDAWTEVDPDGTLRNTRNKGFRDMNRFLAAHAKKKPFECHGEAVFDLPIYKAVVLDLSSRTDVDRLKKMASNLAKELNLPLKIIK